MRIRRFLAGLPALFLGAVLVQSVFATTYVINDGGRTFSCTLYTASTREALSAAGVELTEADVYTREADTIYVRRAPTVTLTYHGKSSTVVSEEETVRQLLDRLGIAGRCAVPACLYGFAAGHGAADRPGGEPGGGVHPGDPTADQNPLGPRAAPGG